MQLRKTKHIVDIDVISIDQTAFMESQEDLHLNNEIGINHTDIKLKDCLEQLSLQQRKCIELFYLKTHCYSEIVKLTQYDLKKVKSYIQNGKRNLKNCLEK